MTAERDLPLYKSFTVNTDDDLRQRALGWQVEMAEVHESPQHCSHRSVPGQHAQSCPMAMTLQPSDRKLSSQLADWPRDRI